ncbi:type IX secretion system membrane protein PorP/SprF [Arenibacter sp. M-2]|uniref:PorP/SprF family type IX secretion system membrane protein n=1 Tax=unclassified Arenibacter TaxID=2615047 RepID=UPI000D767EEE|nr:MULTISPECIES: type IX secretion system membrane protein PorP/SprF [unclassified Arenibacter]MDL5510286.1 type IX secretion system membrane protein PorP/SprF [Arenibacter sp. M-2]PXX27857.1 type IX secretion system PorP/SprF family membrane protein [Arenibacter sp. ARW7G5Y1]|tara:strand:- start:741 stop:1691 length:951 start_codon:yes stop_codon:yes gene_type:complete
MRSKLLTFVLFLSTLITSAQELNSPQLSQYLADNPFVLSPTYAGIGDHVKIRLNGLAQWVGIKDAPRTQSLAADMRLGEKSGIGLFLYNDSNGYTKQQGARISFAHHLTLDRYEDEFLSFGISYNFNQFRLDVEEFIDAGFDPGVTDDRSTSNHNFDVGLLYRKNSFYFSVNASNVINKDVYIFDPIFEPNKLRNFYAYTGYRYKKSRNSNMEIEPSLLYKIFESDGRSEADLNLKFRWYDFEDYYYAGVTYRFLNDQIGRPLYIAPLAGLKKSNFYFGYSYQIILNEILGYSTGTHVVTIGVDLFQGISNCRCTY